MSDRLTFRDKLHLEFFEQQDNSVFTPVEQTRVIRLRALFTHQLENPWLSKSKLVEYLMHEFGIEKTQAYNDTSLVESLLGNVRNASKAWIKYVVTQNALEVYLLAKEAKDLKNMNKANDLLGKYNNLDKEDEFEFDEEKMYIDFEPTDDITVLSPDMRVISPEDKEKVRQKLLKNMGVVDIEAEEV
jgi:hypothetical protein